MGESETFRIDSGVKQGCFISLYLFNACYDVVMKEGNMGIGWRIVRFLEDGREWRLPSVLYANGLVLCGESEKELS